MDVLPIDERGEKTVVSIVAVTYNRCSHQLCKTRLRFQMDVASALTEAATPIAHSALGDAYFRLKRYDEAIAAFKEAIRIKPDYAKAYYDLGVTYLQLGDKGSAMEQYKILKNLNADLANQLFNMIPR